MKCYPTNREAEQMIKSWIQEVRDSGLQIGDVVSRQITDGQIQTGTVTDFCDGYVGVKITSVTDPGQSPRDLTRPCTVSARASDWTRV